MKQKTTRRRPKPQRQKATPDAKKAENPLNSDKIFVNLIADVVFENLLNKVFKDGLTYSKGLFRTPSINDGLVCNVLHLKQIGLLEIEQPYHIEKSFSSCGERGIRTPGPMTVNSFQDCRIRPLCQLSAAKVQIRLGFAN